MAGIGDLARTKNEAKAAPFQERKKRKKRWPKRRQETHRFELLNPLRLELVAARLALAGEAAVRVQSQRGRHVRRGLGITLQLL